MEKARKLSSDDIAINAFLNLAGTNNNDTYTGTDGNDTFDGLGGNDVIDGRGGDDWLQGGEGDDVIEGGLGNDTLNGGGGLNDTVVYWTFPGSVTVDLGSHSASGGEGTDVLAEFENVAGSTGSDTIRGDGGANVLDGNAGNDFLYGLDGDDYLRGDYAGQAGNDVLDGGNGNDRLLGFDGDDRIYGGAGDDLIDGGIGSDYIDGGTGADTLTYRGSSFRISVNLATGTASDGTGTDVVLNVENVDGSEFNDVIQGDGGANFLYGWGGDDTIDGGDGDDVINGGLENDIFVGGLGTDRIVYGSAPGGVTVNLETRLASGAYGNDSLTGIENADGSNYDDTLTGDSGNNELRGRDGNDSLWGGYGDDRLVGGGGNDHIVGGYGEDTLLAGTAGVIDRGYDTLDYDIAVDPGTLHNLRIDLIEGILHYVDDNNNSTYTSKETFSGFEAVIGWKANDFIFGTNIDPDGIISADNILDGRDGNDYLNGRDGNDTLIGGNGNDTFVFSNGADHVQDFRDGADHIEISAIFGATRFDQLTIRQSGADTIIAVGANSVTLDKFSVSNLDGGDFFFVP
ncbi:MAG TPA: calcium-binding protein [Dongiaceae bacterium]|jgi:Ca2+-binding RTX toxin-like protein|nr:calcium-binding protein [Dongiaceae bacterium]